MLSDAQMNSAVCQAGASKEAADEEVEHCSTRNEKPFNSCELDITSCSLPQT